MAGADHGDEHHDDHHGEHAHQHQPAQGLPPLQADDRRHTHGSLRNELLNRGQEDDSDTPAFVQQGRQRERSARRWKVLLWVAVPLLLLALVAQLGFHFRSEIAARSPEAAHYLRAACRSLGCTIRLPMQIDQLSLVSSRLDAIGDGNGRFQLVALIRNQGDTVQALPTLDLKMKNAEGQPLVRKAFLPTLYATQEDIAHGMPAHSEREVHLLFELAGEAPAGFDLTLFYH